MVGTWSVAKPTITSAEEARTLDTKIETRFNSSVRKGDARKNPRGGAIANFKSYIGDGFGVAKERKLNCVRDAMPAFPLLKEYACFKKSKGAAQSQYISLNESNFEELTRP